MQLSLKHGVSSKAIGVRPSIVILVVAVFGALACAARLAPVVQIAEGNLRIQDFAYHYLLASVADSTAGGSTSPYSLEARRVRIERLCIDELKHPCDLSHGTQPVGLSPIGFVELFGMSKVFGSDSRGALLGYTLLAGATFFVWLSLGRRLLRLSKRNLLFVVPLSAVLVLSITSPFEQAVVHGQPSFLVVALVAVVMLTERHTNPALVGSVLALTAIKPHYFALACVLFAAAREWRGILLGGSGLLCLAVLAGVVYGTSVFTEYPAVLREYASGYTFYWFKNPLNLGNYLPVSSHVVTTVGSLIAILLSVVSVGNGSTRMASCLPLVFLFFSPYVARYEIAVLMIPALGMFQNVGTTFSLVRKPSQVDVLSSD
jgi:hypothetical protein